MHRRTLLTRQQGQRHLGLDSIDEDDDVRDMHIHGKIFEHKFQKHSPAQSLYNSKTIIGRLSLISEYPTRSGAETDCCSTSVNSVATGLPSLASIKPGSVTGGYSSFHSRSQEDSTSGPSTYCYDSIASNSSSYHHIYEDTVSVASSIAASEFPRHDLSETRDVLLRRAGNEEVVEAETLEYLEPSPVTVMAVKKETALEKWGSSPTLQRFCTSEIMLNCPPFVERGDHHNDASNSPASVVDVKRHELASRNADADPPSVVPTPFAVRRTRSDSIPTMPLPCTMRDKMLLGVVPRRRSAHDALGGGGRHTNVSYQHLAFDQIPSPPQRRGSLGRHQYHQSQ
jgi:hypothetical protein